MCGLFDRFLATTWVNVFVYRKRDSNLFKLVSPCFMLQVSSYPWIRWSICNTHATPMHSKRSYSLPSPAPVLTLQVAPEKQLKHVTPTKSTFQDTFQVGSVTNIFLPFTLNALSIRIQNCVEGFCHKCKPFKTCIFYIFHNLSTQTAIRIWQSHEQNLSLHCIASAAIGTAGIGVECGSGSDALHQINMTHPQYVCIRLHVQDIHKTPQKPQKIKSIANHVLVSSKSCAFGSMTDFAGGTWNRMRRAGPGVFSKT